MITFSLDYCKDFSQKIYEHAVGEIPVHRLSCCCGKKGCLAPYGYYHRTVKTGSQPLRLRVKRLRCSECGNTHALLPSFIVPYSQISKDDQQEILEKIRKRDPLRPLLERCLLIDENNVKYILRQFRRHWKERILSLHLTLEDDLTQPCLSVYSRQFMQIHRTPNIYFSFST